MDGLLTGLAPLILLTCMGWQEAAMAQRCVVHRRSGGQLHLLCTGLSYSGPGRISGSAGHGALRMNRTAQVRVLSRRNILGA